MTTLCEVVSAVIRMFVISCDRTISKIEVMDVAIQLQCKTSVCFQQLAKIASTNAKLPLTIRAWKLVTVIVLYKMCCTPA